MKILVLNGPNINLLGIRERGIYGTDTYEDLLNLLKKIEKETKIDIEVYQSNHEGALVDRIQKAYFNQVDGIVINPAAYTHTSIAILDALQGVMIPSVEVHISNVKEREDFRQLSYVGKACIHTIMGKGILGYQEAIFYLMDYLNKK